MATTLFAAFTAALAYTTSGDVRATWELARLTEKEQRARDRPVVVVGLRSFGATDGSAEGELLLRNVGLGPALSVDLGVDYLFDQGAPGHLDASWDILMVGEEQPLPIMFSSDSRFTRSSDTSRLRITGTVADRTGLEYDVTLERALRSGDARGWPLGT